MYRWHAGYVAWLLNRITGVLITAYLVMHIWVIHHLAHGPESYQTVMDFLGSKIFVFFEICLVGVVLYHMMNGIRIIFVDFGKAALHHKLFFWVAMAAGVLIYVACIWEMAGFLFGAAAAH